MAFSCVTRDVFSILHLLVILSSIIPLCSSFSPSDKVTKELLHQICPQPGTENNFCMAWLISDPKTLTLDLGGLVELILQNTLLSSYKNIEAMKSLERTTTDPTLKTPYLICVKDYELAVTEFKGAQGAARSKSYEQVHQATSNALERVSSCEADLTKLKVVPPYDSLRNFFEKMCYIATVFSKVLIS